jgi:hypothetical protein
MGSNYAIKATAVAGLALNVNGVATAAPYFGC